MADVTYTVEVEYLTKGSLLAGMNNASAGVKQTVNNLNQTLSQSLSQSLSQTLSQRFSQSFSQSFRQTIINRAAPEVQRAGATFGDILSAGMLSSLAVGGIEAAVKGTIGVAKIGLVEMNADVEQLGITMASMFAGAGQTQGFAEGLRASSQLMKTMRKDARELPGEFKDLAQIMMRITTPAANMGLSVKETEELAANAMAIGVGGGMRADVVGRELGELIRGNMSKRMPLLSHMPNFSMDSHKFNAMAADGGKHIARLKQAMGMVAGTQEEESVSSMRRAFMTSWVGAFSTLKDNVKLFLGTLTSGLFGSIKDSVNRFNDWFADNQSKIESWAKRIGTFLTVAFTDGLAVLQRMIPHMERLAELVSARGKDSTLKRDVGVASAAFAGLQVARLGASAGEMAGASMMGGAEAGLLGTSVGLLGPLAIVVGAVMGAIEGLTNELGPLYETMNAFWNYIVELTRDIVDDLTGVFHNLWPILRRLGEFFGLGFLTILSGVLGVIEALTFALDVFVEGLTSLLGLIRDAFKDVVIPKKYWGLVDPDKKPKRLRDDPLYGDNMPKTLDQMKANAEPPKHTTHIHKVEIKVNSNQDPNRIAKKAFDLMMDVARHPKTATNSGIPRMSNG